MDGLISHVSLGVDDLETASAFYDALLTAIGARRLYTMDAAIAWGRKVPEFWVGLPIDGKPAGAGNGTHVAFLCVGPDQVRAGYAAGLAAGGSSDGAPGPRPEYTDGYYAAFLRDPFGNKVEVHSL
ncbi:MAG: VOC family protein [Thalassobaculaceae bacterium]|nr:VOC family protein [Thalassobaculaceae bacterium]